MSMNRLFNEFESLFGDFESIFNNKSFNTEKGKDWVKQTYTSPDGSCKVSYFVQVKNGKKSKSNSNSEVDVLKSELSKCIESQDFEKAVELRDKIKSIESNKDKIESLKNELEIAIKEQNFEKAIELRDTLKSIEK